MTFANSTLMTSSKSLFYLDRRILGHLHIVKPASALSVRDFFHVWKLYNCDNGAKLCLQSSRGWTPLSSEMNLPTSYSVYVWNWLFLLEQTRLEPRTTKNNLVRNVPPALAFTKVPKQTEMTEVQIPKNWPKKTNKQRSDRMLHSK